MRKLIMALGFVPVIAFSNTSDSMQAEMNKELIKAGLPTPGSGVQVVPDGQIQMPEWQKDKFKSDTNEQRKRGYVDKSSPRAHELIHISEQIKRYGISDSPSTNEGDSGLHKNAADIAFSYSYIGVPKSEIKELYGVAPTGAFLTEPQKGWTGAVVFFNSGFAHCAYTEKNIMHGQGGVQIEESIARYDVNGKVTTIDIEGNESTGFLYNIFWFDINYYRELECATKNYSKSILDKSIELAKKIDKN